jgi:hypothetical protein
MNLANIADNARLTGSPLFRRYGPVQPVVQVSRFAAVKKVPS